MENSKLYCFGDLPASELMHSDESAAESTTFGDLPITVLMHSEAEPDDASNDETAGEFTSFGDPPVGELMHDDSLAHDDTDADNEDVCCFGDMPVSNLEHSGIKGMKWGVRRYQNPDGSLTPAGKKRYNQELTKIREAEKTLKNKQAAKAKIDKLNARKKAVEDGEKELESETVPARTKSTPKKGSKTANDTPAEKKSAKEMSTAELEAAKKRLELERDYAKVYSEVNPQKTSRGKKFANKLKDDSVDRFSSAAADILAQTGKVFLAELANKTLNNLFDPDGDGKKQYVHTNNKK